MELLGRFERRTELPLAVLAFLLVPIIVLPFVMTLPGEVETLFVALDAFIWGVFVVEYLVRLYLVPEKWPFIKREWLDLLFVAIPFLRPLRVTRSVRALRLLRLVRLGAIVGVAHKYGRAIFRRHNLDYVLLAISGIVLCAALLVFELERTAKGASIRSLGDSLWWAVATVTTVGYGDKIPVTGAGQGIAAVLMVTGVTLMGVLAANLASVFLKQDQREAVGETHRLEAKLDAVIERAEINAQMSSDPIVRLEHLAALRSSGALTDEEYEELKSSILRDQPAPPIRPRRSILGAAAGAGGRTVGRQSEPTSRSNE